jgi:DNA-3-methyladenine glycosylase II
MKPTAKSAGGKRVPRAGAPRRRVASHGTRGAKSAPAPFAYHAGPPIDGEAALALAVEALLARDPEAIGHMLSVAGAPPLRRREPGFEGLVSIIVSQQVSTASANAIMARVRDTLVPLEAATVAAADDALLRSCGLSGPKMRALRSLAAAIVAGLLPLDGLAAMAPADACRALLAVKGIGPWTANIFLLFCLGHPDAWPAGDLALQEAARLALKLEARPDIAALEALGERWRPYRGVAARLLWAYYRATKRGREGMALNTSQEPGPNRE